MFTANDVISRQITRLDTKGGQNVLVKTPRKSRAATDSYFQLRFFFKSKLSLNEEYLKEIKF